MMRGKELAVYAFAGVMAVGMIGSAIDGGTKTNGSTTAARAHLKRELDDAIATGRKRWQITKTTVNGDGIAGTSDDRGYCTDVVVHKNASNPFTVIHADGYSTPCEATTTSARALQRSVELHY